MILELNMFSGQTYLSSFEEYERVCAFLGIRSIAGADEDLIAATKDFAQKGMDRTSRKAHGNLCEFMKVLFTVVRRDSQGIDKTHLGKILHGAILTRKDFEDGEVEEKKVQTNGDQKCEAM